MFAEDSWHQALLRLPSTPSAPRMASRAAIEMQSQRVHIELEQMHAEMHAEIHAEMHEGVLPPKVIFSRKVLGTARVQGRHGPRSTVQIPGPAAPGLRTVPVVRAVCVAAQAWASEP